MIFIMSIFRLLAEGVTKKASSPSHFESRGHNGNRVCLFRHLLQQHVAIQDARVIGIVEDEIQHTDKIDGRERVVLVLLPAPELRVAGPIEGAGC